MNNLVKGDILRISTLNDVCNILTEYSAGQELFVVIEESHLTFVTYELNGQTNFLFYEHLEKNILTYEGFFGVEKFLYEKVELKDCPFWLRVKYKLKKLLKLL